MLKKRTKEGVIKKARVHDKDTGSPEVQVGILTKRIEELSAHLKTHHKDKHSRRGLLQMVADRHAHMRYLKKKDPIRAAAIAKKFGIKLK